MTDRFARCEGRPYLDGVWGPLHEASCWGLGGAVAADAPLITPTEAMLGHKIFFFTPGRDFSFMVFSEYICIVRQAWLDIISQYFFIISICVPFTNGHQHPKSRWFGPPLNLGFRIQFFYAEKKKIHS